MLGVQPAFVRRLDAEQVVEPLRSDGGHRRYTRSQILQVQRVSDMAGEGLTIAGIRRILVLEAEVADLQRQLAELHTAATKPADTTLRRRKTHVDGTAHRSESRTDEAR